MAISNIFGIDYTNKRLYTLGDTNIPYTVNDLYSHLQDTFDEQGQMDDPVPMSAQTPTEYTLINGWFAGDSVYKLLKTGAITTSGWNSLSNADGIRVLTFTGGYVNAVAGDIGKTVSDDQGDTGTLLDFNNDYKKWWIRVGDTSDTFTGDSVTVISGTGKGDSTHTEATGENLWANVYTLGTLEANTMVYIIQNEEKVVEFGDSVAWYPTGHIDILLKVKEAGDSIGDGTATVFARQIYKAYDHFPIALYNGGRNAVPIATAPDLNNDQGDTTDSYGITITFGNVLKDLNNGNGDTWYDVVVACNSKTVYQMYNKLKYITRRNSTTPLGNAGDTVNGEQYVTAESAYTPVKSAPFGTFAGGTFFGARGIWIEGYHVDDSKNFQLIDQSGNTQVPPNVVTVKVTSVVSGDRISVFVLTSTGGSIKKNTYTSHATLNHQGDTSIVVQTTISSDTPSSGYVRVYRTGDTEWLYAYSSWSTSTFVLDGDSIRGDTLDGSDTVYVPLIDAQAGDSYISNTLTFSSTVPVLVRVRKKGILPFQVESSVANTGMNVAAIRTTDNIVQA